MYLLKIGGGESINIQGIIQDLAESGEQAVILHGANALRDSLMKKLQLEKTVLTSASGYDSVFTNSDMIDVMIMSYAGLRNKRIVELCQQNGINAVGLSGLDGGMIRGLRNKGIRVKQNNKLKIVRDFSGKPKSVNMDLLNLLLENGYTPVLSVPILDENMFAVNTENDDILAVLQAELSAETVVQFIEAPGFLDDKNDESSLVDFISKDNLIQREAQVDGRMKRKLLALRKLLEFGAGKVILSDGRTEHPLQDSLAGKGTELR